MITGPALVSLLIAIVVFGLIFCYVIPLLPPPFNIIAQIVMVIILILWLLQTFVPSYRVIGINDPFPGQHLVLGDGGTAGQHVALSEGINFKKIRFGV